MDAAWLEDFLALVDLGHFSRAAEQRCITRPAFSRRVRALEDWVGAPLFGLGGGGAPPIPLLTYTGESGLGRILASSRAMERSETAMRPVFTSHLTSVLVAMARDAHGLAWAPLSVVADDLERGRLCRASGEEADVAIEIKLYRPRARQSPAAEHLWTLVAGRERDAAVEGDEASD